VDDHIQLNLGNILIILGVSIVGTVAVLGVAHVLSRSNVPVLSPAARGTFDAIETITHPAKAA